MMGTDLHLVLIFRKTGIVFLPGESGYIIFSLCSTCAPIFPCPYLFIFNACRFGVITGDLSVSPFPTGATGHRFIPGIYLLTPLLEEGLAGFPPPVTQEHE